MNIILRSCNKAEDYQRKVWSYRCEEKTILNPLTCNTDDVMYIGNIEFIPDC
jgi:hypothetical protein